jgi:hypothetical protein
MANFGQPRITRRLTRPALTSPSRSVSAVEGCRRERRTGRRRTLRRANPFESAPADSHSPPNQVHGIEQTTARRPAYCSFECAPDFPESWPWPTSGNLCALRSSPTPERARLFRRRRAHSRPRRRRPDTTTEHRGAVASKCRGAISWQLAMANFCGPEATASGPVQPPEVRALVPERRDNKGARASGLSRGSGTLLTCQARGGTARITPKLAMANFGQSCPRGLLTLGALSHSRS